MGEWEELAARVALVGARVSRGLCREGEAKPFCELKIFGPRSCRGVVRLRSGDAESDGSADGLREAGFRPAKHPRSLRTARPSGAFGDSGGYARRDACVCCTARRVVFASPATTPSS